MLAKYLRRQCRSFATLAVLEQKNGTLAPSYSAILNAAKQLQSIPMKAVVLGPGSATAAQSVKAEGVEVLYSEHDAHSADVVAQVVHKVGEGCSHIVAAHSTFTKDFLPRLAALRDLQPITDVIKVIDCDTFVRPAYANNALMTVKSNDDVKLVSFRVSSFPSTLPQGESEATEVGVSVEASLTEVVGEVTADTTALPQLGNSKIVISGGRGCKSKDEMQALLMPLCQKLQAAMGASRAAVDAGWCENDLQVGQTGKVVAPHLYIAVGISGAIQHLAGMKDSKTIVAINKDPEAPIFKVADYGLVADVFTAVPELTQKL